MNQDARDAYTFAAGAGLVAVAAILGSFPLLVLSGAGAWWLVARNVPRGGLIAALAVALVWTNAAVVTTDRIGAPETVALAPQVLLGVAVIGRLFVHERHLVATPAFCALLVHGAVLLISALFALDHDPVVESTQTFLIEGPILWFLIVNAIDDRRTLERVTTALVVSAALLGALSVVQYAAGSTDEYLGFAQMSEDRAFALANDQLETVRLSGPIGEKNRYAQVLLVVVPVAAAVAMRRRLRDSSVHLAAAGLCIAGIALTASRGATVGLAAVLLVMLWLRVIGLRALAVLGVSAALALALLPGYRDRVVSLADTAQRDDTTELDGSTLSRITENLAALNMFIDHPVVGVGLAGYPGQYGEYAERIGLNVRDAARQPHNLYLGIAAESGALGLGSFLAVFAVVLRRLYRGWRDARSRDPALADLAAGWMAAISAYLVSGIFLHLSFERYLWLLLAMADVTARIVRRENKAALPSVPADPRPDELPGIRRGAQAG